MWKWLLFLLSPGWVNAQAVTARDIRYYQTANGLKVLLLPDPGASQALVALYYQAGFRQEARHQEGFAHLLEHLTLDRRGGYSRQQKSWFNGSTTPDYTSYYALFPPAALPSVLKTMAGTLWPRPARRKALQRQLKKVQQELEDNILYRPYGGFPWLDLPLAAFGNRANAHPFYGEPASLQAATRAALDSFAAAYYIPNNAVLVVSGKIDSTEARQLISRYFGTRAARPLPVPPDHRETAWETEKRVIITDSLAARPALGIAYPMPEALSPEFFAMGLVDELLAPGGINRQFGGMFACKGPMLWIIDLVHDHTVHPDSVIMETDQAIRRLEAEMDQDLLDNALQGILHKLDKKLHGGDHLGRADLLACMALFGKDPLRAYALEQEFRRVDPALVRQVIRTYLQPKRRTIVERRPARDVKGD